MGARDTKLARRLLRMVQVEVLLASALEAAARARRWDVVAQLAKELEAQRLADKDNGCGDETALSPVRLLLH